MSRVRVAVVASTLGVGGAEVVTAAVLRRLPAERFDTSLYFLHGAGTIGRDLMAAGFPAVERLCKSRHDALGFVRLWSRLRRRHPHIVFCLDHRDAMLMGRLAGLCASVPALVVASHSTGLLGPGGRVRPSFGALERTLMEFTTRVIAVSHTHARYLRDGAGTPAARITVIENGIDPADWPPVNPERRAAGRSALGIGSGEAVVAMVAAMRPEKAHEALLEAVARLADAGRRVRVLLAGDGERRGALEQSAQSLGIAGQVDFLGVRRDVARLLHAADVVVLPSRAVVETLPLSLLEAMACGIPVVASAVGSVPEIVEDRATGLLVPPADAVALARAIAYTLEDPHAAAARCERARALVRDRYTIERTSARYAALFEEVAA